MSLKTKIPIPSDASEIEKCWFNVRAQTFINLPLETALSFPMPVITEKAGSCLTGFYYGISRGGGPGKTIIKPPIARLIATYPDARILSFVSKNINLIFPGLQSEGDLGLFVSTHANPTERKIARKEFFDLYSEVVKKFFMNNNVTDVERESFNYYWTLLAEEPLFPYYKEIGAHFFDWIES